MKRPAHGAFNGKGGSSSSSFAKLCGGSFRVGSGISPQKTRTFFKKIKNFQKKITAILKKNKSFFKNVLIFLPCMKCRELYDHIPQKYKPFTYTFSSQKAKKHPTLHQAGISYKKVYITDNKHVIRKNASKRSEGMRDQ